LRKPNDQPKSKPANSEEQLSLCCSFVSLKQYVILCDRFQTIEPKVKQDARGLIEEFIAIHGNDVSPRFGVELFHKPRSRGFCNLACGEGKHDRLGVFKPWRFQLHRRRFLHHCLPHFRPPISTCGLKAAGLCNK